MIEALRPETADAIFDRIAQALARPELRPRVLVDRFGVQLPAATDDALGDLASHASPADIARCFDAAVETESYWNFGGFTGDSRAFLSIPAWNDLWRRGVAQHLEAQVARRYCERATPPDLVRLLAVDLAREVYRL